MLTTSYDWFLIAMTAIGLVVFIALYFVKAGYGIFLDKKWGAAIPNRVGWIIMEAPVFIAMCVLWYLSDRRWEPVRFIFFFLFQLHYFQRAFIFPFLIKGSGKMPFSIVFLGIVFNVCNAFMQGGWIFYVSPPEMYQLSWFWSPQFIIGVVMFFSGMFINMDSDRIIRDLRKPGDRNHYLPRGGMFRYVSSANYFGELLEWVGFAVFTWSWAGVVFAWWTFANLAPRANALYHKYEDMFGDEFKRENRKRIIPFIY